MGITFLCCVNDEQQLNRMLVPSLDLLSQEGIAFNVFFIDARKYHYHSAAEAFNVEVRNNADELKDILVFLHQDIAFDDCSLFLAIIDELKANPNQIIGVAGMPTSGRTVSNLKYRNTNCYITATQVTGKTSVCSIDECFFAVTKDVFYKLRFNEKVCNGWHLYAVELCYHAMVQYHIPTYVLPHSICHKENGSIGLSTDTSFLKTMWKLARKYKDNTATIYAPCYIVKTSIVPCLIKIGRSYLKNSILH